jgi:GNAT superfamily N-acetyltransferase
LAGFARAVTDRAVFAYLADVFVLSAHRGLGLGVWVMETMLSHPDLQGLRRVFLVTADAHGLYERFGFHAPRGVERFMEIAREPTELY